MTNLKILIANDGYHAHYFERKAWINAFNSIPGIQASMYECKTVAAFDAFNTFEPDIFIGQLYNLDSATIKCIKNRPWMKVALRAGDWGTQTKDINSKHFNILTTTDEQIHILDVLKKETGQPEFIYSHYLQDDMFSTHNYFESKLGIKPVSILLCADLQSYCHAKYNSNLACDIGFVGGYWPYKGVIIDQMLTRLCFPVGKYNIKIFGNQPWPHVNQYCGHLNEGLEKHLFVSATICPNLSEPHAHAYGIEINERSFKILCAGGFCISDNVPSHRKIFRDGIVFADNPIDFEEKINYYLKNPEQRTPIIQRGRDIVLANHTNFHRAAQFLRHFGYDALSTYVMNETHTTVRALGLSHALQTTKLYYGQLNPLSIKKPGGF